MGEEGTWPLLKEEYHYHPGCPGCAYDRRKDLLRGKPYKEFLYVWMVSLTAGTHFSSLHRPLFQLLLLSGDFSLELVTLDNLNDHMLQ